MKQILKSLVLVFSLTALTATGAEAQLGGLMSKKKSSGGADVSALADQQAGIVKTLVNGFEQYTQGQAQIARALGLKKEADKLDSEHEALASGNVKDKSGIKRSMKVSANAQKAIDKKIAAGGELSGEAKTEFSKAMPFYARGTAYSMKLIPEVKKWGSSASGALKSAGMMDAAKLKKKLGTGLFVVSKLPGYVKNAKGSYKSLMAFAKKNEIDTSGAEDLLGDDF